MSSRFKPLRTLTRASVSGVSEIGEKVCVESEFRAKAPLTGSCSVPRAAEGAAVSVLIIRTQSMRDGRETASSPSDGAWLYEQTRLRPLRFAR